MTKDEFINGCWICLVCSALGIGMGFSDLISSGAGFVMGSICLVLVIPVMYIINKKVDL